MYTSFPSPYVRMCLPYIPLGISPCHKHTHPFSPNCNPHTPFPSILHTPSPHHKHTPSPICIPSPLPLYMHTLPPSPICIPSPLPLYAYPPPFPYMHTLPPSPVCIPSPLPSYPSPLTLGSFSGKVMEASPLTNRTCTNGTSAFPSTMSLPYER